jgi:Flp pilus assembly protein CpaB
MALRVELSRISLPVVNRRTVLGIALAAVAATLVIVVTRPAPTLPILVAGADLPAGTPLAELDVTTRHVADASGFVSGNELGELSTWSLRLPINEGEPLLPSMLQSPERAAAPDLMSLELDAAHAVLGRLSPGDLVDVYATIDLGPATEPTTELIADRVHVVDTATGDQAGAARRIALLVAVDGELAATLTAALHNGELDLVRVGP